MLLYSEVELLVHMVIPFFIFFFGIIALLFSPEAAPFYILADNAKVSSFTTLA